MLWLIWPLAIAVLFGVLIVLGNRSRRTPPHDVAAQRIANTNAVAMRGAQVGLAEATHRPIGPV